MNQKHNLTKNLSKVSSGTFLSKITGLVRDIFLTHFLGATWVADSFGIAFVIPNMLRGLFGEGALAAAFIPSYTDINETQSKEDAIKFGLNILTILIVVLVLLVILGIILAPLIVSIIAPGLSTKATLLTEKLTRILFPYLFLIGLTSIIISILNVHTIFFLPSFSPAMMNLGIVAPVFIYSLIHDATLIQKAYFFAGGVIFGGILQLLSNGFLLKSVGFKLNLHIDLKHPELKSVWRRMIPGIIGLGIREVNVLVDTLLASLLAAGTIASLQYGNRLMQLPLGVFGIAMGIAVLPLFSLHTAKNDQKALKTSLTDSVNMILLIMLPILGLILVLGKDIIALIFLHGVFDQKALQMTYNALAFYSLGLVAHSCVKIFANAFFALKNTKKPMIISGIAVICNIIFNLILMRIMGLRGLALASSIAATIQAVLLLVFLTKEIGKINFKLIITNTIKIGIIAGFITIISHSLRTSPLLFSDRTSWMFLLLRLLIIFISAFAIYITGLKLFRVKAVNKIYHIIKKRISK